MRYRHQALFFLALLATGIAITLGQTFRNQHGRKSAAVDVEEKGASKPSCSAGTESEDSPDSSACCNSHDFCCTKSKSNSKAACCQTAEARVVDRKSADEFMLMMQGMAGIGPEDSRWVRSKLFEGFIPAPMPCCGPPGSKDPEDEHQCCERQASAVSLSETTSFQQQARVRFEKQFGPMLGRDSNSTEFVALNDSPPEDGDGSSSPVASSSRARPERPADLCVKVLVNNEATSGEWQAITDAIKADSASEADSGLKHYEVSAISVPIFYNRFGDQFAREDTPLGNTYGTVNPVSGKAADSVFGAYDPDGMIYVLDSETDAVQAGSRFFNGGHDPIYYGVGRGNPLYLKDPRKGLLLNAEGGIAKYDEHDPADVENDDRVPVLTVEPLVLRANRGDTVVIDFTNRLDLAASDPAARANLIIEGATYDTGGHEYVGKHCPLPETQVADAKNAKLRYVIQIPEDQSVEGTYYFHSQPVVSPETRQQTIEVMRTQTSHGLFGALIVEPPDSEYLDSYKFAIRDGSADNYGDYEIDQNSYHQIQSGWAAIIRNRKTGECFREHVIFFHDDLRGAMVNASTEEPRALSYRYEGFDEIFAQDPRAARPNPGKRSGPFAVNDHSMAYSAYAYGDASTPHPRFYVGDPMRYRIVHSGMGDEFHVFHHHAHRWRFQPNVTEPEAECDTSNLTRPSKRGLPQDPRQPDLTVPVSSRLDSQTLGPGETFDVFMEGGAGGTQRTVGDSLLHCHIIEHVTQGMWTYARVYNTLQLPDRSWYPSLAPLPDRVADPTLKPLIAVDSARLADMIADDGAPDVVPVSGPLAGNDITHINQQLIPYIESQLPPQGYPERDKKAHTKDKRDIHRANQWDWETLRTPSGRILYLGERYDLGDPGRSAQEESYVKFGIGFPTSGEGIGAHRDEPNPIDPDGPPIDRPRLMFNPRDGRLAFPHLLPHAGRRPPFAPRHRLEESADPDAPPQLVQDKWSQGTAYLGKTIKESDPDGATGTPFGSGLAPEGAPIKRFDLVALQLPITYSTFNGRILPNGAFEEDDDEDTRGPIEFFGGRGGDNVWGPESNADYRNGDTVSWFVEQGEHGLIIRNWIDVKPHVDIVDIGLFDDDVGQTPRATDRAVKLLSLRIHDDAPADFGINFVCTEHSGMTGRVTNDAPGLDPSGQIFVLADDAADIIAGRKPAEPLVLRANTGEIVEIRLRSALKDDPFENEEYSKVGIHTHLVQYDVQSSDGAVGGLNYETSIRPSLRWNETDGEFECVSGRAEEAVHYRWWCDVELGTVYFHDHSLLKDSLPHGLFGATIVEPEGATYHDSNSGRKLYREREEAAPNQNITLISGTTDVIEPGSGRSRGLVTADIHFSDGADESGFREYVPLFQDASRAGGAPASVNLRSAPLLAEGRSGQSPFRPYSNLAISWHGGVPSYAGGKATLMSSALYGHPPTPIWRAFPGDDARIRVEGGATNFIHSLSAHGHRWRLESGNSASTTRDFVLAGVSEAFTIQTTAAAKPGDYLYGSTGSSDLLERGLWGIWRVQDPGSSGDETHAEVKLAIFLGTMPDSVVLPEGRRFVTRNGAVYKTTAEQSFNLKQLKEQNYDYFQITVRSDLPGEQFNVPYFAELALDPSTPIEGLQIERIISLGTTTKGRSSLQALPGKASVAASSPAPSGQEPSLLEPADQPDLSAADTVFDIAAVQVNLPIRHGGDDSGATAPIFAYVPLQREKPIPDSDTITEGHLADEIAARTRAKGRRDRATRQIVSELREVLQNRFTRNPDPLVIRVAAPKTGETALQVGVRLINLLPLREEVDAQFGPTRMRPFGFPYSPLTSIHVSLADSSGETSDGSAVGRNRHSLIPPGDARKYLWRVDQELGICAFRDAGDPDHAMNGLFGALIVEPNGTRFLDGGTTDREGTTPGCHAIVFDESLKTVFREYVLFMQDGFAAQPGGVAINYRSAGSSKSPDTPHLMAYSGDEVRIRQVHASGTGNQVGTQAFFVGGRRWRIDDGDPGSNRISSIAEAPLSAVNMRFTADADLVTDAAAGDQRSSGRRTYFYGSHVAEHLKFGEWGEFTILADNDVNRSELIPLPRSDGSTDRTNERGE